jgi:hypothetical protein
VPVSTSRPARAAVGFLQGPKIAACLKKAGVPVRPGATWAGAAQAAAPRPLRRSPRAADAQGSASTAAKRVPLARA